MQISTWLECESNIAVCVKVWVSVKSSDLWQRYPPAVSHTIHVQVVSQILNLWLLLFIVVFFLILNTIPLNFAFVDKQYNSCVLKSPHGHIGMKKIPQHKMASHLRTCKGLESSRSSTTDLFNDVSFRPVSSINKNLPPASAPAARRLEKDFKNDQWSSGYQVFWSRTSI